MRLAIEKTQRENKCVRWRKVRRTRDQAADLALGITQWQSSGPRFTCYAQCGDTLWNPLDKEQHSRPQLSLKRIKKSPQTPSGGNTFVRKLEVLSFHDQVSSSPAPESFPSAYINQNKRFAKKKKKKGKSNEGVVEERFSCSMHFN